jgi:hypothetical protein
MMRVMHAFHALPTETQFVDADAHSFARALGSSFRVPTSEVGFQHLQRLFQIRNRLAHPRSVADLGFTDEEFISIIETIAWIASLDENFVAAYYAKLEGDRKHAPRRKGAVQGATPAKRATNPSSARRHRPRRPRGARRVSDRGTSSRR